MTQHSIFIGYRRDETADASSRVFERLLNAFGREAVFKDVDDLPVGTDFGAYILTVLPKCRVFLAMIGPSWADIRDDAGARRLDDPGDWVRIELETALQTPGLQVVPVLVNGARMPNHDDLPESLHALVRLNAAVVRRDPDFHKDMDKLCAVLEERGCRAPETPAEAALKSIRRIITDERSVWSDVEGAFDGYSRQVIAKEMPRRIASYLRSQEYWSGDYESILKFKDDDGVSCASGYTTYMASILNLALYGVLTPSALASIFTRFYREIPGTDCTITTNVKQRMIRTIQGIVQKFPELAQ